MFTVLIAEQEHIDAICVKNKLFFEPFLENKELVFCAWNPKGQSLSEAVPGLYDAVGRRSQWRAVIINPTASALLKAQNPFDAVDFTALKELAEPPEQPERPKRMDDSWNMEKPENSEEPEKPEASENSETAKKDPKLEEWEALWKQYFVQKLQLKEAVYQSAMEQPLQKLSTWLCFRPEDYILKEVSEKSDAYDWAMKELSKGEEKASVRLEHLTRQYAKQEQQCKEHIRRAFMKDQYLNIAYPSEMQCVSLRTTDNKFFDPDTHWTVHQESEYSSFADRNMYFDKMRFMVFDLLPKTHRDFRNDYIRFLAFLLILASNPVPGSTMQTRRLYRIEMEIDERPLRTLVTSYDRKLAASYDRIEAEMEQIRGEIPEALTDKAAELMFCTPTTVEVVLDEACDTDQTYASKDYGLFFDSPENEFHKWDRSYKNSEKALTFITKQQSRAVRKSVSQMHFASETRDVNISRLTPLQIEDVRDYTDAAEDEMVNATPPDLSDISKYKKSLEEASTEVKKVIAQRMKKKTALVLGAICLALFFICFCPFLLDNGGSARTITTALGLIAGMTVFMAVLMGITLVFLRSSVTRAVANYNERVRIIMNEIQGALKKFSTYLGAVCSVRRGHFVQNYAQKNVDEYTKSLRIRKKHQEDIRKKRACLEEEYADYLGDRTDCDEVMSRPYEYDFGLKAEYTYPAPFLAGDCRQIDFMSGGNIVTVPSSYVKKVTVRMEGIYEK